MVEEKQSGSKGKAGILGGFGILGFALLKFKVYIFAALKGLTFLKFGWLIKSFVSIFLSIAIYWAVWGPAFAVIIVVLLMIHEAGHWVWMKACGLNPRPMILVPFIGAYVQMDKMPTDQATHAWVALAGPLVGGVASAAFYWFGVHSQNGFLMAAGSVGFFLNLLQLIPAKPFDGGFVISAVSKWFLIPGTVLAFVLSFLFHSLMLLIIAVLSTFSLFHQFKHKPDDGYTGPPRGSFDQAPATVAQKTLISIAYLGLAGMLGYLYFLSHSETISMLPAKQKAQALKYHHSKADEEPGETGVSEGESDSGNRPGL